MVVLELVVATTFTAAFLKLHQWYIKNKFLGKHHVVRHEDSYVVPGGYHVYVCPIE
mgnify:CR=1 FL=1